ncbi:anaphase-promoting complex subunit 4-like isoform X2 [Eucalyptus grandis]|uniref:anaphase-promoting complex subunit 4-like isoform X2 n=1 Tax=Eucalyptus grandis TaxID=71139 RepID=UPI00192EE8E6|nr:anaphase-promoting complex subunit 4-like isoform X2 [Eucalyptus grandis]
MRGEDFGRPTDCFVQNRFESYRGYCNLVEGLLQKLQNATKLLIGSWCLQLCCIHVYMEGGVGESKKTRRNGKLLRSLSPMRQLGCLNWEEDARVNRVCIFQLKKDTSGNALAFEDCTTLFFPPAPGAPCMPGLVPGETGLTDNGQDSFVVLSNSSKQCFNILQWR